MIQIKVQQQQYHQLQIIMPLQIQQIHYQPT